jgi:predicted DNA-binding protein (UPF0251 family)
MTELKPCSFNFKPIKEFRIKAERKPRKQIELDIYRFNEMQIFRESGMTYEEIGKKFGLSRQRVHQILKENRDCKIGEYFSQDITFCSNRNCKNKKCKRNSCHINWTIKPYHSFADFEGTRYCIKGGTNNDR